MVTISRQAGAGGDEIARLLAEELGWKLLDNEAVEKLLVDRGFHSAETDAFEERKPDFWHRFPSGKERYLHFLKLVSYEFARRDGCVILGRGGQVLFASVPGTVRVRIIAPLQDRVARMLEQSGGDEHKARQAIQHSDSERAGFHRFLFHVDWDSPDLYDLVINTHAIPVQVAAGLVAKAISARETAEHEEGGSAQDRGPLSCAEGHRRHPVRAEAAHPVPGGRRGRGVSHAAGHGARPAIHRALPGDRVAGDERENGPERDPLRPAVRGAARRHRATRGGAEDQLTRGQPSRAISPLVQHSPLVRA